MYRSTASRTNDQGKFRVHANALKKNSIVRIRDSTLPSPFGKVVALFHIQIDADMSLHQLCLIHKLNYTTNKTLINPMNGSIHHGIHSRTWMPYTRLEEAAIDNLMNGLVVVPLCRILFETISMLPDCTLRYKRNLSLRNAYYIMYNRII